MINKNIGFVFVTNMNDATQKLTISLRHLKMPPKRRKATQCYLAHTFVIFTSYTLEKSTVFQITHDIIRMCMHEKIHLHLAYKTAYTILIRHYHYCAVQLIGTIFLFYQQCRNQSL